MKFDETVKSRFFPFPSFWRRPESSIFNKFWMPDQVRHDELRTFYEIIKFNPAFFISAILFLLIISSGAGGHAGEKNLAPAPMAMVEQPTAEFARVVAGTPVEHRFTVKNKGTARLDIINVYSG